MIDTSIIILFGMAILGMLGAFFLGTWTYQERVFNSPSKTYEIEAPDDIEVTDEEYEQSLRTRMFNDEQSEQGTG